VQQEVNNIKIMDNHLSICVEGDKIQLDCSEEKDSNFVHKNCVISNEEFESQEVDKAKNNEEIINDSLGNSGCKIFVGQIPKEMNEDDLFPFFEEFGSISELSIIRDSLTLSSKGCAFVTFLNPQSAESAVEKLHDKVKLRNSQNGLQVRMAETAVERENKLFVGMLPKTATDRDLGEMFSCFGELREVHIIRGPEGSPKGCAFVKFVDRGAAVQAIRALHDSIPPGASRPLVVKFADSKKDRRARGEDPPPSLGNHNLGMMGGMAIGGMGYGVQGEMGGDSGNYLISQLAAMSIRPPPPPLSADHQYWAQQQQQQQMATHVILSPHSHQQQHHQIYQYPGGGYPSPLSLSILQPQLQPQAISASSSPHYQQHRQHRFFDPNAAPSSPGNARHPLTVSTQQGVGPAYLDSGNVSPAVDSPKGLSIPSPTGSIESVSNAFGSSRQLDKNEITSNTVPRPIPICVRVDSPTLNSNSNDAQELTEHSSHMRPPEGKYLVS
jgi:hypothetical protein